METAPSLRHGQCASRVRLRHEQFSHDESIDGKARRRRRTGAGPRKARAGLPTAAWKLQEEELRVRGGTEACDGGDADYRLRRGGALDGGAQFPGAAASS